jgi:hypothetical protein
MFGRLDNSFDLFFSFFLTQVFFVVQSSSPPIQLGDDADVSKVPKIFASHFPNAGFSSSFFFCCFSFSFLNSSLFFIFQMCALSANQVHWGRFDAAIRLN